MSPFKRQNLIKHLTFIALITFALSYFTYFSPLILWVVICNLYLFLLIGDDKKSAEKGQKRTPESTLLTLSFLSAFPALFFGRKFFRHKTVKKQFIYPMWALFVLQVAGLAYILFYF